MTNSNLRIDFKVNRRFRRFTLNTVITLYLLIMAGGVVRSTGAGMGCPDWPRCFGRWVPPTEVSQLPVNYKELYGVKLKGEVIFNPVKTWIEYVNRLLGAFTGIMIFATLLASIPYLRNGNSKIFVFSLLAFILVGVQGWLGSKVVSFELLPVIVTLHMLLAIVIVFIVLYLYTWAVNSDTLDKAKFGNRKGLNVLGGVVLILSFVQIMLGTQVREAIDEVVRTLGYDARNEWIGLLGAEFYIHRSFSLVLFATNVLWIRKILKGNVADVILNLVAKACILILVVEIMTGIVMAYFGIPAFAQPVHLVLAILMIGLQFVALMHINADRWLKVNEKGNLIGEHV